MRWPSSSAAPATSSTRTSWWPWCGPWPSTPSTVPRERCSSSRHSRRPQTGRTPGMTQFWFAASTEEFPPSQMLEQARAAERAGFDGLGASDHFAPWWPDGQGSQAWVTLAAIGQHTTLPLGTGVTPIVHHYHPAVVAQAFMSLEELYPGRVFLGAGSGEAVNETPLGLDWPSYDEQRRRLETGLEAITRLWAGETVTMDAGWFKLEEAKLWTRAKTRPKLYVSAFGPQSAELAGRYGDGLWTLVDPEQAPEIVEA